MTESPSHQADGRVSPTVWRTEIKGYGFTRWMILHSVAAGIIGVLFIMEVLALGLSRYYEMSGLQEIMYLWEMEDSYTAFHSEMWRKSLSSR